MRANRLFLYGLSSFSFGTLYGTFWRDLVSLIGKTIIKAHSMLRNGDVTNVGMKENNVILKPQVKIQLLACLHISERT